MLARKLFMVCSNPDVVVERGSTLVYCAGAIADLYATMGGEVLYAGKPYRPIYEMALTRAEEAAGRKVAAQPGAGGRGLRAYGSQGRPHGWCGFPVRDVGYSRRGAGQPGASR
jgi:hypothetical protein